MKLGVCIVILGLSMSLVGCNQIQKKEQAVEQQQVEPEVGKEQNQKQGQEESDDSYIELVKQGCNSEFEGKTYEEAFKSYFSSPDWKYLNGEAGEKIVEFTGDCNFRKMQMKTRLQFVVDRKAKTFQIANLYFNDVAQDQLTIAGLMSTIFGGEVADQETTNVKDENKDTPTTATSDANGDEEIESTKPVNKKIDKEEAIKLVRAYLEKQGEYIPRYFSLESDKETDPEYVVHAYDIIDDNEDGSEGHTATVGWYYVDKETGEVVSEF